MAEGTVNDISIENDEFENNMGKISDYVLIKRHKKAWKKRRLCTQYRSGNIGQLTWKKNQITKARIAKIWGILKGKNDRGA